MLPTTGRFKYLNCPFYEACICERPYCHFKHTKKEPAAENNIILELVSKAVNKVLNCNTSLSQESKNVETQSLHTKPSQATIYNPTPIAELNKYKTSTTAVPFNEEKEETVRKSRHIPIQYTPEPPKSSRTKAAYSPKSAYNLEYSAKDSMNASSGYSSAPSAFPSNVNYVPSSIKSLSSDNAAISADFTNQVYEPFSVNYSKSDTDPTYSTSASSPLTVEYSPTKNITGQNSTEHEYVPTYSESDSSNITNTYKPTEITKTKQTHQDDKKQHSKKPTGNDKNSKKDSKDSKHSSRSSSSHKSCDKSKKHHSNSTSSSKRRSSSSSSSKSKERSSSSSLKSKRTDSDRKSSHSLSKSSIEDKSKSSGSKPKDNKKLISSIDLKSKKSKSSGDKHSDSKKRKLSKSSTSKSKDKHEDKCKKQIKTNKVENDISDLDFLDLDNLLSDEDTAFLDNLSDYGSDDSTMEECKRIFQEYQPPANNNQTPTVHSKPVQDIENGVTASSSKKRVAHEKSSTVIREKKVKPPPVRSAALVMANRYKAVKQKLEETQFHEERTQATEFRIPNNHFTHNIQRSVERPINNQTEANSEAPYIPKTKRIAHVPNVSLLLTAKKKVQEIVQTQPINKTPTQTIPKGSRRVAHIPEISIADVPSVLQAERSKLPINVRNRYLLLMVTECLKLYISKQAGYERALNEELNCYSKCSAITTYRNSVMLSVNKLRKEVEAGLSGNGPHFNGNSYNDYDGSKFYNNVSKWILTEEELVDNCFPRTGIVKGHAIFKINKIVERVPDQCHLCARCKKIYKVNEKGLPVIAEECVYHPLRKYFARGESKYACCGHPSSGEGCCLFTSHVFEVRDPNDLTGFMTTFESEDDDDARSVQVYALDCEMVYTSRGLELARVTVIDNKCNVVYESLVKPFGQIIDYNTRFSGLTEEMMQFATKKLTDVQATLLSMFNSKTILIGHSLESDLKAMRIIHDTVIDTSVMFPHKMGPPKKRALRNLASDYLQKIIQNSEGGHDSAEDAITCMELVIWKLKEELKTK